MPLDDRIRIQHMPDAAKKAINSAKGRDRGELASDPVWALGLVKCLEIVGEAAARVKKQTRAKHPQIPWTQIITMRNRLVHLYFEIDQDQVWKAVTEDMPPLVEGLERILAPPSAS